MLTIVAITALVLCGLGMAFSLFMLARNSWTYTARMSVLHDPAMTTYQQLVEYKRLPDYDAMMWRFWVWDVKKFMR